MSTKFWLAVLFKFILFILFTSKDTNRLDGDVADLKLAFIEDESNHLIEFKVSVFVTTSLGDLRAQFIISRSSIKNSYCN